jgi:hypothetical protein
MAWSVRELLVGGQIVQGLGALLELLEGEGGREVHHVGRHRVDEIGHGVVGPVEHGLDVGQLEEDHELHDQQRIVGPSAQLLRRSGSGRE